MCPSEVSDIEHSIWQKYKEQGVGVWGMGADDPFATLQKFQEEMGLTFPILYDEGGLVHEDYNTGKNATNSVYPQDWIVGVDGTVVYVNNVYEPEEMMEILDAEVAKMK